MKPPICKKILADIPGSETFNLIPHLLRLEPSFGKSSVTNPQTDSRIIYNRYNTYQLKIFLFLKVDYPSCSLHAFSHTYNISTN